MRCFPPHSRRPKSGGRPWECDPGETRNSIPEPMLDCGAPVSGRLANIHSANLARQENGGRPESQRPTRLPARRPVLYAEPFWNEDGGAYMLQLIECRVQLIVSGKLT